MTDASEQVSKIADTNKLRPTEEEFKKFPGYKTIEHEDGYREWTCDYNPNKDTREGAEIAEMLAPWQKADAERAAAAQSKVERVAVTDGDGQTRYLDAALADDTARQSGWSHRWRAGGLRVERGIDGMLFQRWKAGWYPTGRLVAGIFGKPAPRTGVQRDPDGNPWRFIDGAWIKTC